MPRRSGSSAFLRQARKRTRRGRKRVGGKRRSADAFLGKNNDRAQMRPSSF
jgi:hypothetical protein